jgi:hypothetical protein
MFPARVVADSLIGAARSALHELDESDSLPVLSRVAKRRDAMRCDAMRCDANVNSLDAGSGPANSSGARLNNLI